MVAPPLELVHLVFGLLVGCTGAVEGNIGEGRGALMAVGAGGRPGGGRGAVMVVVAGGRGVV